MQMYKTLSKGSFGFFVPLENCICPIEYEF